MLNKYVVVFFIIVLLLSCGGLSDIKENLGEDYVYLGEGTPSNYIYKIDKLNGGIGEVIIQPNVEMFNFNQKFILVRQKPNKKSIAEKIIYQNNLGDFENETQWEKLSNKVIDSINTLPKYRSVFDREINHYIIDKRNNQIYGPLSQQEFEQLKNTLHIKLNLK